MHEFNFLKTLWRWKVLTYPLARHLCFPENSESRFYFKARRLIHEGYIIEAAGDGLSFHVLQLTKKGFNLVQHDLGELKELRFNPQSVAHDYWATAFQLGSCSDIPTDLLTHITEQEIQSLVPDILPAWAPVTRNHVPDGLFQIRNDNNESLHCALEVDINLKSLLRYDKAAYYFDGADCKIDVVFWLCGNLNIAESIYSRLQNAKLRRFDIHHFFVTDDFKYNGCHAEARSGQFAGKKIHDILTKKGRGNPEEDAEKTRGKEYLEILFPKLKTPFKKRA